MIPQPPPAVGVCVRRPKAIVFDILGTASKSGFLEKVLFPFLKVNLDNFINTHWTKKDFMKLYHRILEQSVEFNKKEPTTPLVLPHDSSTAKTSLLDFINFVTDNGINTPSVTELRFKVWFEGYQQSKLRTPIYSDVPNRIRTWFAEGIKFYVFSNTWVEAQKALLRNTNHGDLTTLITGHYDNDFGLLAEPDSWRRLCGSINESPNDVLFLTKSIVEARAAAEAGLMVVLVLTHRHNVKAISHEERKLFPIVRSLNELGWVEGSMMPGSETPSGIQSGAAGPVALSGIQSQATARSASTTNVAQSSRAASMPLVSGTSTAVTSAARSASQSSSRAASSGRAVVSAHSTTASAHSATTTPHSTSTTANPMTSSSHASSHTSSKK